MKRGLASLISLLTLGLAATAAAAETVEGNLLTGIEGLSLADAGPIVVFLVSTRATSTTADTASSASLPTAVVRQKGAQFEPRFLAVAAGQDIKMPNDDIIFHNVFSYSAPNDFDLGLYASGKSKTIRFAHAGLVRIYCSIHETMDALIFVAPTNLHTSPDAKGRFSIRGVPAGRYQVHVWSERLPEIVVPLEVNPGVKVSLEIEVAPSGGGVGT